MKQHVVGIDVGGTQIKLGLFDGKMQLVSEQKYLTDKEMTTPELLDFLSQKALALV